MNRVTKQEQAEYALLLNWARALDAAAEAALARMKTRLAANEGAASGFRVSEFDTCRDGEFKESDVKVRRDTGIVQHACL